MVKCYNSGKIIVRRSSRKFGFHVWSTLGALLKKVSVSGLRFMVYWLWFLDSDFWQLKNIISAEMSFPDPLARVFPSCTSGPRATGDYAENYTKI
jgi:hypothetical protein